VAGSVFGVIVSAEIGYSDRKAVAAKLAHPGGIGREAVSHFSKGLRLSTDLSFWHQSAIRESFVKS